MSLIIISAHNSSLGYEAYEPKYKKEAVFKGGEFVGFIRNVEIRSMIAVDKTLQSTLIKAIGRRLKDRIMA